MELEAGDYVLEQSGLEDYYSFSIDDDEDLSEDSVGYSIASTITGQILATQMILMIIGHKKILMLTHCCI